VRRREGFFAVQVTVDRKQGIAFLDHTGTSKNEPTALGHPNETIRQRFGPKFVLPPEDTEWCNDVLRRAQSRATRLPPPSPNPVTTLPGPVYAAMTTPQQALPREPVPLLKPVDSPEFIPWFTPPRKPPGPFDAWDGPVGGP
jgi:hypothetical protein